MEWKPIEEASLDDDTEILGYQNGTIGVIYWADEGCWGGDPRIYAPSHFIKLPDPPQE